MIRFAEKFSDFEIVTKLSAQLSWSHFIELMPLKTEEARLFYANDVKQRHYGVIELRRQISRKAYERREIADTRISKDSLIPFNMFKDPYFLDVLIKYNVLLFKILIGGFNMMVTKATNSNSKKLFYLLQPIETKPAL